MLEPLQVFNPIIGLTINIIFQILSFRYICAVKMLQSVFLGFFAGLVSVVTLQYYIFVTLPSSPAYFLSILLTNIVIYAMLGYCYFHFVNLGETARRIRILRELYDSGTALSLEEILERYNARKMVEVRINRLVDNGQIIYKKERYYIGKPVVLTMAKIIVGLKRLVLSQKTEFNNS